MSRSELDKAKRRVPYNGKSLCKALRVELILSV